MKNGNKSKCSYIILNIHTLQHNVVLFKPRMNAIFLLVLPQYWEVTGANLHLFLGFDNLLFCNEVCKFIWLFSFLLSKMTQRRHPSGSRKLVSPEGLFCTKFVRIKGVTLEVLIFFCCIIIQNNLSIALNTYLNTFYNWWKLFTQIIYDKLHRIFRRLKSMNVFTWYSSSLYKLQRNKNLGINDIYSMFNHLCFMHLNFSNHCDMFWILGFVSFKYKYFLYMNKFKFVTKFWFFDRGWGWMGWLGYIHVIIMH